MMNYNESIITCFWSVLGARVLKCAKLQTNNAGFTCPPPEPAVMQNDASHSLMWARQSDVKPSARTCEALIVPHVSVGVSSLAEGVHVRGSLRQKEPARGLWKNPRNAAGEQRLNTLWSVPTFIHYHERPDLLAFWLMWPRFAWNGTSMGNKPCGSRSRGTPSFLILIYLFFSICITNLEFAASNHLLISVNLVLKLREGVSHNRGLRGSLQQN